MPGAEPAGAMRPMSWAYPSRMALRRFCSDMIWLSRFWGVESKGFDRAEAEVDEEVAIAPVGFSGVFREGEGRAGGVEEALEVVLLSSRRAEGSSMGVRECAREWSARDARPARVDDDASGVLARCGLGYGAKEGGPPGGGSWGCGGCGGST